MQLPSLCWRFSLGSAACLFWSQLGTLLSMLLAALQWANPASESCCLLVGVIGRQQGHVSLLIPQPPHCGGFHGTEQASKSNASTEYLGSGLETDTQVCCGLLSKDRHSPGPDSRIPSLDGRKSKSILQDICEIRSHIQDKSQINFEY